MIELQSPYRQATQEDAVAMSELVNMAGEGLPYYLWSQMIEDNESAWDVGQNRAKRESGGFSYRNTIVREEGNCVVACLIGYALSDKPDSDIYQDLPAMFIPLQELEDLACSTWYVNVLATYPEFRGKGYGVEFLQLAEQISHDNNLLGISVIVSDGNPGARRLYERHGFIEKASRAMVKNDWENDGSNWVLLTREW